MSIYQPTHYQGEIVNYFLLPMLRVSLFGIRTPSALGWRDIASNASSRAVAIFLLGASEELWLSDNLYQ